jgi:hypothetical protein
VGRGRSGSSEESGEKLSRLEEICQKACRIQRSKHARVCRGDGEGFEALDVAAGRGRRGKFGLLSLLGGHVGREHGCNRTLPEDAVGIAHVSCRRSLMRVA